MYIINAVVINHTFSAFWLRSSVVSVLISVKTGISPTGETFSQQFFTGGGFKSSLLDTPSKVA
jgi:hypothetical protein